MGNTTKGQAMRIDVILWDNGTTMMASAVNIKGHEMLASMVNDIDCLVLELGGTPSEFILNIPPGTGVAFIDKDSKVTELNPETQCLQ